jgi:hypothetical protein
MWDLVLLWLSSLLPGLFVIVVVWWLCDHDYRRRCDDDSKKTHSESKREF